MITPPLSISARPVLTRNVARSAISNPIVEGGRRRPPRRRQPPFVTVDVCAIGGWATFCCTRLLGGTVGELALHLGVPPPDPGIGCRSGSPPGPAVYFHRGFAALLLQLEGANP